MIGLAVLGTRSEPELPGNWQMKKYSSSVQCNFELGQVSLQTGCLLAGAAHSCPPVHGWAPGRIPAKRGCHLPQEAMHCFFFPFPTHHPSGKSDQDNNTILS